MSNVDESLSPALVGAEEWVVQGAGNRRSAGGGGRAGRTGGGRNRGRQKAKRGGISARDIRAGRTAGTIRRTVGLLTRAGRAKLKGRGR